MVAETFECKPQAEEFFTDAGYYKQHEAYHLLKFHDEKMIMRKAFKEYNDYRKGIDWKSKKTKDFSKKNSNNNYNSYND